MGKKDIIQKNLGTNEYEEEVELLATADILFDFLEGNEFNFDVDYSGIIIGFSKAIERFLYLKYGENKDIVKELLPPILEINPKLNQKDNPMEIAPIKFSDKRKQDWITKMIIETYIKKNENAFWPPTVTNKLYKIFKEYEKDKKIRYWAWDMFVYNTLFFFYHIQKNTVENKFNIFRDIYFVYKHRTGAAHKDRKTKKDALYIKSLVLDGEGSEDGLMKRLINFD